MHGGTLAIELKILSQKTILRLWRTLELELELELVIFFLPSYSLLPGLRLFPAAHSAEAAFQRTSCLGLQLQLIR